MLFWGDVCRLDIFLMAILVYDVLSIEIQEVDVRFLPNIKVV